MVARYGVLGASAALSFVLANSVSLAETAKITVWREDDVQGACDKQVIEPGFNGQSETAEVEFVLQAEQWDVTRTALAGGAGPDIVTTPGPSFVFELAKSGLLLPMTDYAAKHEWGSIFVDWALSLGEVEGALYSLPTELETIVLYYNKTLFEEKGWSPPATIDELTTLAQTAADDGVTPFAAGNAEWRPANEWFVSAFLNHVTGPENVYEALKGDRPWTDPGFAEAMTMLDVAQQNGWFSGGLDLYYTATFDQFLSAFGSGEAAMNIEGSWRLAELGDYFGDAAGNANEWDWVPMPSSSGDETYSIGIGSTYSINAASEQKDAAAEFLTYMFSPETQAELAVTCGRAPAPIRISANLLEGMDPRQARLFESIGAASDAGNYGYLTWTFWPPKSDVYIYEQIELVWDGQMSVDDYLAGLQEVFSEELEAGDIPPLPSR